MSFGYSVGDLVVLLKIAKDVRKRFINAPIEFKGISESVNTLSNALRAVEGLDPNDELLDTQKTRLNEISQRCNSTLHNLQGMLDKPQINAFNLFLNGLDVQINISQKATIDRVGQHQDDERRDKILNWMADVNYGKQQSHFLGRRESGTGRWLLHSSVYTKWLDTPKETLYCHGVPGAGKTMLAAIIIEDLVPRLQSDKGIALAYVYFNFTSQNKTEDHFMNILMQLSRRHSTLPDCVEKLYKSYHELGIRPTLKDILSALHTVAATYSRIFVVIDALDECRVTGGCRERRKPKLYDEIKETISSSVDGMFLLAHLYLNSLQPVYTANDARTTLKQFRREDMQSDDQQRSELLEIAYANTMDRIAEIPPGQRRLALDVLMWITCAKEPLTTHAIQHAMALNEDDTELDRHNFTDIQDMVTACAGLVTVDNERNIIRLVHYTTQEYFDYNQKKLFNDAPSRIATVCITYLAWDVFDGGHCDTDEDLESRLQDYALYDYAARNWGFRYRPGCLDKTLLTLLCDKDKLSACTQAMIADAWSRDQGYPYNYSYEAIKGLTGYDIAVRFGLQSICHLLLQSGRHCDMKDADGRTPLSWATEHGHKDIIDFLLQSNANANSRDGDNRTPLLWEASSGHLDVVPHFPRPRSVVRIHIGRVGEG